MHTEHNYKKVEKIATHAVHRRDEITEEILNTILKVIQALQNSKQI